jgi:hypothetical protein
MRKTRALGALFGLVGATLLGGLGEREASACGGCFTPPPPPTEVESVISDEKMIFSISKDVTTLFDEITYSGSPASFAWVLPIRGTVTVGLSADIMFATMEQLTATQVVEPPTQCPPPPSCGGGGVGCGGSASGEAFSAGADGGARSGGGGVTVLGQQQVGPYETVQLESSDGSALDSWLKGHGYRIPESDVPVIAAYVSQGFDFLALKLVPGKGVQAMQPVRVTSKGAAPSLPLHMVAIGTGPTTGITIWVVADGRWAPGNFPTFQIEDSEISWDWTTSSSNYETLRLSKEAALGGRGWQIESSLELSQYTFRNDVTNPIQYGRGSVVGGYTPIAPGAGDGGSVDGGSEVDAGDVAGQLAAANADIDVLFAGVAGPNARITRMRSDVAHSALSEDMALVASKDTSELSNLHYPKKEIGQPQCPVYDDNCTVTGTVPRDQAVAEANGGCHATRSRSASGTTLALVLSAAGFGVVRIRRRRRKAC